MSRIVATNGRRLFSGRARKLGGSLAASVGVQILLTMSGVLVARALGPEDRGYLALLVVVSGICVLAGSLGLPTAVTYFIARNPPGARAITRSLALPVAVLTVATTTVQFAVLFAFVHHEPERVKVAALISLFLVPGILAQSFGLAILQGQERFRPFNVLRILPTGLYAFTVLAVVVFGVAGLVVLMTSWVVALFLGGVLALGMALAGLPPMEQEVEGPGRKRLFRFGLKGLVGSTSPIDALRMDQALVALFLTPVALGLYVVGGVFTNLPRIVAVSVGMVAYPHVASQGDPVAARRSVWRYFFLGIAMSGAVVAVL